MKRLIFLLAIIAAVGCDRSEPERSESPSTEPSAAKVPADNTGRNERDQSAAAVTPTDQKENEADLTITQQIRQGVIAADAISASAKNVKIVTVDGVVTLRGPVESQREKSEIATLAKRVDGVKQVDNQLEIAAK